MGLGLARDEVAVPVRGEKGVGVFSVPARSGAPVSTDASERGSVCRGAKRGLDNKNRPLNTVITIQLRS